jgi:glycosyltransferase involved in cell wall biosynthesis
MALISIVHVINGGPGVGGAERMLSRIVGASDRARFEHTVLTILPCQYLESEMHRAGVRCLSLDVDAGVRLPARLLAVAPRLLGLRRASLFVGWLNYGNVLASLLGAGLGGVPVVLNFRGTYRPSDLRRPVTRAARILAPRAARRLANSQAAVRTLRTNGFGQIDFIANGFSLSEFRGVPALGNAFRREHGIPPDAFLFGHVGRFHPMKDQANLLRAAQRVLEADARIHIVLVGRGMTTSLAQHRPTGPLARRVHLVESTDRPQEVYSALDAYVHSSGWGEGFPNVIAEAMLHTLPIICTDVAESRAIVGAGNRVVPPGRHDLLAAAMLDVFRMPPEARKTLGASNRARIASLYSIDGCVREFERHFLEAIGGD